MRRITVTSDLFVMLGLLAVILGHFRYTRRIVAATQADLPKRDGASSGVTASGLSIPAAATAALVAGAALLKSAARRSTAAYTSKPL